MEIFKLITCLNSIWNDFVVQYNSPRVKYKLSILIRLVAGYCSVVNTGLGPCRSRDLSTEEPEFCKIGLIKTNHPEHNGSSVSSLVRKINCFSNHLELKKIRLSYNGPLLRAKA